VEHFHPELQLPPGKNPSVFLEDFIVQIFLGKSHQRPHHVLAETLRRLVGQLNPVLQYRNWKVVARHTGQEQPEFLVDVLTFVEELAQFF